MKLEQCFGDDYWQQTLLIRKWVKKISNIINTLGTIKLKLRAFLHATWAEVLTVSRHLFKGVCIANNIRRWRWCLSISVNDTNPKVLTVRKQEVIKVWNNIRIMFHNYIYLWKIIKIYNRFFSWMWGNQISYITDRNLKWYTHLTNVRSFL